jgi:hypothetical protein
MGNNNKRASGADAVYRDHFKGIFSNNPTNNRLGVLESMYRRILTELATNRFKWTGLPESVDVRFLELTLFTNALSVFYFDTFFDKFVALRASGLGALNEMMQPTNYMVTGNGFGFTGKTLKAADCVPIWANYTRIPDLDIVHIYSTKLAEIDRTVEINAKNARRTKVIVSNENQRLSHANIERQIQEGQAVISVKGPVQDMAFMQAIDLGVDPDSVINMHILRTRIWNECMGLLGIDNANQDKKERLVAAEVEANDDQASMTRYVNLNERRVAAAAMNKKYGLKVTVDYFTEDEANANNPAFPFETGH